jgi:hypothetical protein
LTWLKVVDRIFFTREDIYRVNITKDDAGIVVTSPYSPLLVEKIKTISCHRWDSGKKSGVSQIQMGH